MNKDHILVIGSNGYWAKVPLIDGSPEAEKHAIKYARKNAHSPKHFNIYRVTPDTVVSDIGSLLFPGDHVTDAPELVKKV